MKVVAAIVVRNLRLFFRDRLNVFFSLLGAIILFGLYTLFLGNLQTQGLEATFPDAEPREVKAFVDSWMFAGIILITTITTGLGALSVLVDDAQSGRFRDFLVSPIRRGQIVLGYLIAAVAVALLMSMFVLVLSVVYLGVVDGMWLAPDVLLRVTGIVVLCCLAFTALSALIVSGVRTAGAFSALATIVGTVLGFVAGAYIPVGSLPDSVANVINALPFGQAGMLLRREFAGESLIAMTGGVQQAEDALRQAYGIDAFVGDWLVPSGAAIAILIGLTIGCTALAALRIRARIR
ncbi:multidrug/hemolysin transport system permease protein [Microbacterium sp. cf046]|uniref:ABC transporter permease n=1 Tax=Microbacterium sp. cf046 TaxID=1761803 RepID=UPI0008E58803|nr:ABC transporter permease [Microbacterium sp. cf046]SFR93189.1 multidrug/hemolysin transport system permease protein [Microbacterium sp. cf046]